MGIRDSRLCVIDYIVSWGDIMGFRANCKRYVASEKKCIIVLLYWGVLPAVLAWVCLLLPQVVRVGPLTALFLLTLAADSYFSKQLSLPKFWLQMRVKLTLGALVALMSVEFI